MLRKIFLDMDGVICNWYKGALALFPECQNVETYQKLRDGVWLDDLVGKERMWKTIAAAGPEFWEYLEPFPWAEELIRTLKERGKVYILTSPGDNEATEYAIVGKRRWLKKHHNLPYLPIKDKHILASPNAWLVDDTPDKIDMFRQEGGNGFLWTNQYRMTAEMLSYNFKLIESLMPLAA